MRKQKTSTTSAKGLYSQLGIEGSTSKKKKVLTRKELRKQSRDTKKSSKQTGSIKAPVAEPETKVEKKDVKARTDGPILTILKNRRAAEVAAEPTSKKHKVENQPSSSSASSGSSKISKSEKSTEKSTESSFEKSTGNPYIDAENKEIARLEKLMGIKGGKSGGKKRAADKLNKEYELFEGIGNNFGDFLMDLNDLTDMIEGRSSKKSVFAGDAGDVSDDESPDEVRAVSHLIDDDEQEQSDLEAEIEDSEDDDEGSEGEEDNGYSMETDDLPTDDEDIVDDDEDDDDDNEDDEEEDGDEDDESNGDNEDDEENRFEEDDGEDEEEDEEEANARESQQHIYQPTKGEDIYGRLIADVSTPAAPGGKYVPPARRAQLLATIDESSEKVKIVRRQLNGLMNRLSEQSKDSVVRAVKAVFDANSLSVANTVLRDCVMAACSNDSQLMTSLIPIYAAMIAALHVAVGADVGAFIIESLATSLHTALEKERIQIVSTAKSTGYITSKLANNALLLLVYLYNLRVLHHTLIVDLMSLLAGSFQNMPLTSSSSSISPTSSISSTTPSSTSSDLIGIGELEVELLVCLVDHCGAQLRADDPLGLKTAITLLNKRAGLQPIGSNAAGSSRLRFMLEALTDLRNNKSRRIQSANAVIVKDLRHWLGSIKNALGGGRAGADLCLRVSLRDLLDAEKTGRWWKAGASWAGKKDKNGGIITGTGEESDEERVVVKKAAGNPEEEKLLLLAVKMRFNTATRRNIFVVIMSSRDVDDAYERLQRLELKGKQDREVVRVITECCAQEKSYNAFYSELAAMLCGHNRQYKTSIQFIFWDNFKLFDDEVPGRRTVNLARLLAHLVGAFHLPLAVLKPIDTTDLNANMVLFLATFFMALFSAKISEDTFQTILDRVATTKDFSTVRDNVLYFLQSHLQKIPAGLDPLESKAMEKRRKITMKTMEAMSVLDMAAGAMEQEEQDDMGAAAEKRSKRSK